VLGCRIFDERVDGRNRQLGRRRQPRHREDLVLVEGFLLEQRRYERVERLAVRTQEPARFGVTRTDDPLHFGVDRLRRRFAERPVSD
jgi:hypothetical protein